MANTLLRTDNYKLGHMVQYKPGTTKIYSYLEARKVDENGKPIPMIFFGLQYYLMEYLSKPITHAHVDELIEVYEHMLGRCPADIRKKFDSLAALGYWPVEIKAVPEGAIVPTQNVLMTITNTLPEFYWCVGFLESLLLKVWNSCTVATCSYNYKKLVMEFSEKTCDDNSHIPFSVHDFGYRGVSSEETAAISGAAHLLNFLGSDTVPAVAFLKKYYNPAPETPIGLSVPASEHSVMCSFGRDNEYEAFDNMLDLYPSGIVSIVSDTYDVWDILVNYTTSRKERILARDGKVVFRPDSGNPEDVICGPGRIVYQEGNANAPETGPSSKGALELLWEVFGGTINSKGYKVLNPKVGLIYGDGMHYDRFKSILEHMERLGFASSNLVIGVGGLLLQNHNRDELGFAIKATYIEANGEGYEIFKDPVTDSFKKSKKGLMSLVRSPGGYATIDQCTSSQEMRGELNTVFRDGQVWPVSLEFIRLYIDAHDRQLRENVTIS